jgi:uncharacterized protein
MSNGNWIWYELLTGDADAATRFYGKVVGWTIGGNALDGGMDYRHIQREDGGHTGGVAQLTHQMIERGARPCWLGYIDVDDVDAEVAAIEAEGGQVHMPAMTMENVGRMAMVTDPQGAMFYVMTPQPPADRPNEPSTAFTMDRPQTVRWNELSTTDPDAAIAFYGKHFGWTQEGAMPMGEMGDYKFIQKNGVGIGAVMPKMPDAPRSMWTFYIGVDDIDRATQAVTDAGGRVVEGPHEIPGGEFSLHAIDPQGAFFGLVGPRKG